MSDPYVGQLLTLSFSWAPRGWASCNGQQLSVQQNTALFSLLGVQFGGDGRNTFNLPNFAGRTVVGMGTATWGATYGIGPSSAPPVSIGPSDMPSHSHAATFTPAAAASPPNLQATLELPLVGALSGGLGAVNATGGNNTPDSNEKLGVSSVQVYGPSGGTAVPLSTLTLQGSLKANLNGPIAVTATVPAAAGSVSVQAAGSGAITPLEAPYLVLNVVIATQGLYPTRP